MTSQMEGTALGIGGASGIGAMGQSDDIAQATVSLHQMEWVTGLIPDCDGGLSPYSPIDSYGELRRRRKEQ